MNCVGLLRTAIKIDHGKLMPPSPFVLVDLNSWLRNLSNGDGFLWSALTRALDSPGLGMVAISRWHGSLMLLADC